MKRDDVTDRPDIGIRLLLAVISCALVAVPFFAVGFPPIADLPQHVAQIRLFLDAWRAQESAYGIQWLTPYSLSYTVLGASWALFSPEHVGRVAFLVVGLMWTVTAHVMTFERRRSPESAALISALFFNHATYWGFLSFLFGWPVFVLWLLLISKRRAASFRWLDVPLFLGGGVLLYVSHALWLAAGAVWFVVSNLVFRAPLRAALLRFASFVPVLIVAALWYPRLESAGFTSSTLWLQWPLGRVSPSWLVNAVFGGVRGPLEYVMTGLLVTWVLWSVWQRRHDTSSGVDRELLLVAALFTFAVLILPDKQSNTIYFASRWAPPAAIMLVLAVPPPRFAISLRRAATAGITAVFCLATTLAWVSFERFECSGLQEALNALPERPRVIGLDLIKTSEIIKGRPFLQMFAYAQVLRGGELNFSFAEFAPSVVVYKARRHPPWTAGLEWYAERARHTDFQHFDYAIVNAREAQHRQAAAVPQLAAAIDTGRWRLYRVRKPPA